MAAGAEQALHHAFTVLLEAGDEVLIPAPYWVSYPHLVFLAGGVPVAVEAGPGLKITPQALRNAVTPRTRVLLLNSPANPTGVVYTRAELTVLAAVAVEYDLTIVSDEICDHWVSGGTAFTSVTALSPQVAERTLAVGGVSKTYAMTGRRIGWQEQGRHRKRTPQQSRGQARPQPDRSGSRHVTVGRGASASRFPLWQP